MGVTRFPPRSPKNGDKRVEVRIGPYGKGVGKWALTQARDEWDRIRAWSKEHNRDQRELKKEEKVLMVLLKVFNHAIEKGWLERTRTEGDSCLLVRHCLRGVVI